MGEKNVIRNNTRYSGKTIVFQTENFGFGPTSIALSILEQMRLKNLSEYEFVFVGTGVAKQLAKLSTLFDRYVDLDFYDEEKSREKFYLLGKVEWFISVTSPSAAIIAKEMNVKVCYVEPLLWFFDKMDKRLENVDYFVVQNFTDMKKEFERLKFYPKNPMEVGWINNDIINEKEMRYLINKFCSAYEEKEYFKTMLKAEKEYVLINFGGVDNMLSEVSVYPKIICDSIIPLVQEKLGDIDVIVIGGGEYIQNNSEEIKKISKNVKFAGSVEQKFAKYLIKNAKYCFVSPGLSNLFEVCFYKKYSFGLPAQNYSQYLQMKKFRNIIQNWSSIDYTNIDKKYSIPEFLPEEEGVRRIEKHKVEVLESEKFSACFKERIEKYLTSENEEVVHRLNLCNTGAAEIASVLFKNLNKEENKLLLTSRVDNNNNLFKSIYNTCLEDVIREMDIPVNVFSTRFVDRELENAINNVWITPNKGLNNNIEVITGGPCICYSEGELKKFSLQDIIDILYLVIAAKVWDCKLLFVLTTYESGIQLHFTQEQLDKKYNEVKNAVKNLVFNFADEVGVKRNKIVFADSSENRIKDIITTEAERYKTQNDVKNLIDIYNFKQQRDVVQDKDPIFFEVYARNISMYTANFVSQCMGETVNSYAVVENSTQLKAVQTGFDYSLKSGYKGFLAHYVYLPVTSTSSIEMNHAEMHKGIYLFDTLEEIKNKLDVSMKKCNKEYYENLWPLFLLKKGYIETGNTSLAEQIYAFLENVKLYMKQNALDKEKIKEKWR